MFCDGDFWHGRDLETRLARLASGHNAPYWVAKLRANVERDRRVTAQLELAGRSLKGQLRHADRIGARYVAIIGDNGVATLKDMASGEQHDTGVGDVIPEILRAGKLA